VADPDPTPEAIERRAREWRHAEQAAVCDVLEPWRHGTVVRATRYPSYFDYNLVRVERDPRATVDELASFADEALDGLEHRRMDFEAVAAAEPLRAGFDARGWRTARLLALRHAGRLGPGPGAPVEEVPYDAVHPLRVAWYREDFPDQDPAGYHEQAREVALSRGVQVLALREGNEPVGFAQLSREGSAAEITQVYVRPSHRGSGRGTALTRAAIDAAGDARDLWIVADDEGRPKDLYQRLGFSPAWTSMELTLWP
jgi:ribosomal protein S18 acetylase RimI-like enzyme